MINISKTTSEIDRVISPGKEVIMRSKVFTKTSYNFILLLSKKDEFEKTDNMHERDM